MSQVEIVSNVIAKIAALAIDAGNTVKAVSADWDPNQVVFMDLAIDQALKAGIKSQFPEVETFGTEATPHNPATEGFIDRSADVVIVFPAPGEKRRWY
jgi:hypothetical protein